MGNLNLLENSSTIIGDGDISDFVYKHLVKTLGTKGGLDDVGQGSDCLNFKELELRAYCFESERLGLVRADRGYRLLTL